LEHIELPAKLLDYFLQVNLFVLDSTPLSTACATLPEAMPNFLTASARALMPYTSKQTNYVKIVNNQKDYQDNVESADKHAQSLFLIRVEAKSVKKNLTIMRGQGYGNSCPCNPHTHTHTHADTHTHTPIYVYFVVFYTPITGDSVIDCPTEFSNPDCIHYGNSVQIYCIVGTD